MKFVDIPPLDLSRTRPISPGGSAGDYEMGSPRSWCSSFVLPDRPRTAQSRRPSFSASNAPGTYPRSAWRVLPGSYIAFSLELAEVANAYPPDSKVAQALLTHHSGRYLGLVAGSNLARSPDDTHYIEDLVVLFVSDAPPPVDEAANHWAPIAPFEAADEDGMDLDLERKPISTKAMFPLKNRVQWTTFGTRLQIKTLVESKLRFDIDEDEFSEFEGVVTQDTAELNEHPQTAILKKLRVSDDTVCLPATVWRDIRGGHSDDPTEFALEIQG